MERDDEDALQSSSDIYGNQPESIISNIANTTHVDVTLTRDYDIALEQTENGPFRLEIFPFERSLLGIARPFFILLTMLTNALVVGFFLSIKNRRKASNLLFVSIALSDTLTGIALLPNSFYVYAGNTVYLSRHWCTFFMMSKMVVSRTFHTVSVWQTVLMAVQRYLCVCFPFISGQLCTYWKTFYTIIMIYILAFGLHLYHFFNEKMAHGECAWTVEDPCLETCIYLWASVVLGHLLPCLFLLLLTTSTLISLRKASRKASAMSPSISVGTQTRSSRDRIITITAILIVIVFLIPELPYGIYMLVLVKSVLRGGILSPQQNHIVIAIYELIMTITFHCNFWIYCGTMNDFRQAVLLLFACGRRRQRLQSISKFSRSSSSRSRNGSREARTNVSRTSSATGSRQRMLSHTTSVLSATSDIYLHPIASSSDSRNRPELIINAPTGVTYHVHQDDSPSTLGNNSIDLNEHEASVVMQPSLNVQYLPHANSGVSRAVKTGADVQEGHV